MATTMPGMNKTLIKIAIIMSRKLKTHQGCRPYAGIGHQNPNAGNHNARDNYHYVYVGHHCAIDGHNNAMNAHNIVGQHLCEWALQCHGKQQYATGANNMACPPKRQWLPP